MLQSLWSVITKCGYGSHWWKWENENITLSFDGSWEKRGHTLLNGVVTVILTIVRCYILILCQHFLIGCVVKCRRSKEERRTQNVCSDNFNDSSGGMEVEEAKLICARSESKLGLRYTKYLGAVSYTHLDVYKRQTG